MALLRLRPLVITLLLILIYGSGHLFVTSLTIMFVSAVITFLCFIFKIQLDFECIFSLVEKSGIWLQQRNTSEASQRVSRAERKRDSGHMFFHNTLSLKDLPRPIARKLRLFIDGVMRDFVQSWYQQIGPNEKQFLDETRKALETVAVEAYKRICNMDTNSSAVSLINLLTTHVKTFNDCCNAVNSKYPGISQTDFEQCILELYETRVAPHITSKNQGTELDFLRKVTDMILFKLLPQNSFSCEGGRFMLREILAINGLYKLINLLSDAHFLNEALIDIFEEPAPLEKIIEQWNEEEKKDLYSDEELMDIEIDEVKQDSDDYESATEERKRFKGNFETKKSQSLSSLDNLNEISDNIESRFVTPNHSTTDLSSAEESYDAFDRVLRQNQLEARLPAPVYGSTMVKLYEQNDDIHFSTTQLQPKFTIDEQIDEGGQESGIFSELSKHRSLSAPRLSEGRSKYGEKCEKTTNSLLLENPGDRHQSESLKIRHFLSDASPKTSDVNLKKQKPKKSSNKVPNTFSEPWGYCPPSSSGFYRQKSYDKMNRRQDLFREQLIAKFHSLGSTANPVSCFNLCTQEKCDQSQDITEEGKKRMKISSGESGSSRPFKDRDFNDLSLEDESELKIHSVPERNIFYQTAPNCPTCIEMTTLANPFENGTPVMTEVSTVALEHDCGLVNPHLFYSEACIEKDTNDLEDNESFVSCDSDSHTDLEISINPADSESTLLASTESLGSNGSYFKVIQNPKGLMTVQEHVNNIDCFDILSLEGSDTEFSSASDFAERHLADYLSENGETPARAGKRLTRTARAHSVTTFASVVDSSLHENESQHCDTTYDKILSPLKSRKFASLLKKIKLPSTSRKRKPVKSEFATRFKSRRNVQNDKYNESTDEEFCNLPSSNKSKFKPTKKAKKTKENDDTFAISSYDILSPCFQDSLQLSGKEMDSQASFSGATDTDISTDSLIGSGNIAKINSKLLQGRTENGDITELATELQEDLEESEYFEDAKSIFEISNVDDVTTDCAIADFEEVANEQTHIKTDGVIPIFEGEVILPHPGKMPVSAWMYPIQMISIPKTEVAFEKGWEPGGNKYTLYSIHYDIRIWPEIYKRQLLEASVNATTTTTCNDGHEALPLIREIKRRYREFMYLHNRLTHSQMSVHMKGILRPNRRYAMPFGRMDPDVIAGRRKILESYIVSLVSRQDVCNSREFKEFLGAEGYGNVSFIKPKLIKPKQMENKLVGNMKNALTGSKDIVEKGESSRYFIHGYDVPRMFGYSDIEAFSQHSLLWLSNFVDVQIDRDILPEGQQSSSQTKSSLMGEIEFFQKPTFLSSVRPNADSGTIDTDVLGPRSSGDGSETPESSRAAFRVESPERRFSIGIAALFSNELAARTRSETLSILDARKAAEEIPWPLSDAVMSFICQALKGFDCWLTYENVQQAVLYSLGGLLEWQISRLVDEIVQQERWMKYLADLHDVIWEDGKLKEPPPPPSEEAKLRTKEKSVEKFLEFLPAIVRIIIGPDEYKKWAKGLLHSLQYEKINRHVLYAAVEVVVAEFIPEIQDGFPKYRVLTETLNK